MELLSHLMASCAAARKHITLPIRKHMMRR